MAEPVLAIVIIPLGSTPHHRIGVGIQILVEALRVISIARERIQPIESSNSRVVVPCPEILQSGRVGLFAAVENRCYGII